MQMNSVADSRRTKRAATVLEVKSKTIFLAGRLRPVHERGQVTQTVSLYLA
jgi:hypothetical protein